MSLPATRAECIDGPRAAPLLGVTRERVRQIEERALVKLRRLAPELAALLGEG